jgi:hypothetical protein
MMKARFVAGWLTGCLVCFSGAVRAADPTPAEILGIRPTQQGIIFSTPSAQEMAACKLEVINGGNNVSGLLLRDPKGRPLRRILDTNGDRRPDVWCFYLDGVEVYREMDTTFEGRANQFRWLNSGGMKWGVDSNKDGKIDTWKMISAEEVSQEVLQAIITRDYPRFQALFITSDEVTALGLPPQEVTRIQESIKNAAAKFQEVVTKLPNLNDKTHWLHLETAAPQCSLAEQVGSKYDLVKYNRATILCETNGKHDWIQSGEMLMARTACWRIIDCPSVGEGSGTQEAASTDPVLQGSLDQLRELDSHSPSSGSSKEIIEYNLARANLLEQIVQKVKPDEREQWVRQIADCLGAAAQNSGEADTRAYERLTSLEKQLVAAAPGTQITAYVTFREMAAENAVSLAKRGVDVNKVQDQWLQRLGKFVEAYPTAEDAPEALMQLGMVSEFINKEIEAKKWYETLTKQFRTHPLAAKAAGAMKRLDVEGKVLELAGPTMDGGNFNISQLRGKTVIVYYWASWNKERTVGDFAVLKTLLSTYASRGVELVCVNLDNTAAEANSFLQRSPVPFVQIFQPGGLESPQATQYGVMVLPNLFLVDKDGKVASRTVQVGNLEDELKKRVN